MEQREAIRSKINDLLTDTGEREKIKEMIHKKLVESGWRDRLKSAAKDYIRSRGVDNVTVDEVITSLSSSAQATVPPEVKAATLDHIRKFVAKSGIGVDFDD